VQALRLYAPPDSLSRQPSLDQLGARHDPMLRAGQGSNEGIRRVWALVVTVCVTFGAHTRMVAARA
jgi:hypothetical protein